MPHTHVLIIGAGPAGAGAAATLARNGVDCLLVDKADFPREKLCGGLITGRCLKLIKNVFDLDYDLAILGSSRDINLTLNGTTLSRVTDHTTLHFTMRHDFDHWLLNRAIALGVKTQLGVAIANIDESAVSLADVHPPSLRHPNWMRRREQYCCEIPIRPIVQSQIHWIWFRGRSAIAQKPTRRN